ncbi:hypothetical protein GGR57DRAFT_497965 [Xylariaceae sp. FL1272]|nr:hypothetical protein GGR57DRAFT_497965 [Xylariaceae sp. FL1272]
MHKHLALHCPMQIVSYFHHIRDTYVKVFCGVEQCRGLLDVDTVLFMQYKCPSASTRDRKQIQDAIRRREIFVLVHDPEQRSTILTNILSLCVVIPSIETFHQNMKYFSIGAKILQERVASSHPRGRKGRRLSLPEILSADWTLPDKCVIEIAKNNYRPLTAPLSQGLAFVLCFVDALRDFPRLSYESPLPRKHCKRILACPDEQHLLRFCQRAWALGFPNARPGPTGATGPADNNMDTTQETCPSSDWRGASGTLSYKNKPRRTGLDDSVKKRVQHAKNSLGRQSSNLASTELLGTTADPASKTRESDPSPPTPSEGPSSTDMPRTGDTRRSVQNIRLRLDETYFTPQPTKKTQLSHVPMPNDTPLFHNMPTNRPEDLSAASPSQSFHIPNPPMGEARRSIQAGNQRKRKLSESERGGLLPSMKIRQKVMSLKGRPQPVNFKQDRYVQNQLAAIIEDEQTQFIEENPTSLNQARGIGRRGEVARSAPKGEIGRLFDTFSNAVQRQVQET